MNKPSAFSRWTLITCCTLVPALTQAWGPHRSAEFPITPPQSFEEMHHFPLVKDLGWSVKMTYLLVHPHEEDIDYAQKLEDVSFLVGNVVSSTNLKLEDPNFGWWSGLRLGIGRFLPNHDKWDVNLGMTYIYSNTESSTSANAADNQLMFTNWSTDIIGTNLTSASMSWRLNYFIWDLDIGRYYRLKETFHLHPHIGLRTALIYVDYKTKYTSNLFTNKGLDVVPGTESFSADQDFWGIGPRVGTDFTFGMKYHFSILGNLSASLVYGHDKVRQKVEGHVDTLSAHPLQIMLKERAHGTPLRTNLEASIGLGWERWVKQESVHIATSFQFEASEWFNMNSFFNISETNNDPVVFDVPDGEVERHHGNLGYYGFTFNLQVDF